MSFGQRASDVARGQYWIHPALAEVVENALLAGTREASIREADRPSRAAAPSARPARPWSRPSSASPIQRAYSRRWLGGRAAYAASAAGFSASAASSSGGSVDLDLDLWRGSASSTSSTVDLVAGLPADLPQQVLAQAEVADAAVDHQPGPVLGAVDVGQHRRALGGEAGRDRLGHDHRVPALPGREDLGREALS